MKLLPFLMVLSASVSTLLAQSANPDLQAMVDAEKAFIEMAKTQNRRDAFLYFLTDSAVTQGPNGPVKGKTRIQQQPVTDDWLHWSVNWSEIARSGDFGFNTGPWEYFAKKTDEKPVAYGEFNSVWKKQADGTWKNVLDIGIGHSAPSKPGSWEVNGFPLDTPKKQKPQKGIANELLLIETNFQRFIGQDRVAAYKSVTVPNSRFMFSGHLPYQGPFSSLHRKDSSYLVNCPQVTDYVIMGNETASSHDMGYVYGTANAHVAINGKTEIKKATFVRVWVKEHPKKWTLELDVLSF
jgi:ketosteroid isomerase-like protein